MKLKIYDCYLNITNREDVQECTEEKLEKLDEMLNEFGVSHCFSLTGTQEVEAIEESGREYCVTVMYEGSDETVFEMVYMLWSKIHRDVSDELIYKAMKKVSARKVGEAGKSCFSERSQQWQL